jgi:prevent-host-death family protein
LAQVANVASCGYIAGMRVVGIREFKNRLSAYIRAVRGGESVLVTDRGRVVAEMRPFDSSSGVELSAGLAELVRNGTVRLPVVRHDAALYARQPTRAAGAATRLIDEDRGTR